MNTPTLHTQTISSQYSDHEITNFSNNKGQQQKPQRAHLRPEIYNTLSKRGIKNILTHYSKTSKKIQQKLRDENEDRETERQKHKHENGYGFIQSPVENINGMVDDLLKEWDLKRKSFLDIGCWIPIISQTMKDIGCKEAAGLEYNKILVEKSKSYFPNIEVYRGDLLEFTGYNTYDILYTYNPISKNSMMYKALIHIIQNMKIGATLYYANYNLSHNTLIDSWFERIGGCFKYTKSADNFSQHILEERVAKLEKEEQKEEQRYKKLKDEEEKGITFQDRVINILNAQSEEEREIIMRMLFSIIQPYDINSQQIIQNFKEQVDPYPMGPNIRTWAIKRAIEAHNKSFSEKVMPYLENLWIGQVFKIDQKLRDYQSWAETDEEIIALLNSIPIEKEEIRYLQRVIRKYYENLIHENLQLHNERTKTHMKHEHKEWYPYIQSSPDVISDIIQDLHHHENIKDKSFLDIGCWIPVIPNIMKEIWYKEVAGLEYNKGLIKKAKKLFPSIKMHHDDILKFSAYDKYDVLYAYNPLKNPHLMSKALYHIIQNMKIGATLYFKDVGCMSRSSIVDYFEHIGNAIFKYTKTGDETQRNQLQKRQEWITRQEQQQKQQKKAYRIAEIRHFFRIKKIKKLFWIQ